MQPIRLLLMIVLLAFLPLQGWAGTGIPGAGESWAGTPVAGASIKTTMVTTPAEPEAAGLTTLATLSDLAALSSLAPDTSGSLDHGDPASSPDTADPSPPGADFAEQLLPAPMPRVLAHNGRAAVPRYTGAVLPDPDLPLLPRPPRG